MTEQQTARLKSGEAKEQFIKNLDEIKNLINQGYGIKRIYLMLYDDGKITMKYRSFYALVHPDRESEFRRKERAKKKRET